MRIMYLIKLLLIQMWMLQFETQDVVMVINTEGTL